MHHGHLPHDVDLKLPPQHVQRQDFQGTGNDDPGVVDQAGKPGGPNGLANRFRGRCDLAGVGHVQQHRDDLRGDCLEAIAIGRLADAGEDAKSAQGKLRGGGGADARGSAGNHHGRPRRRRLVHQQGSLNRAHFLPHRPPRGKMFAVPPAGRLRV